ncbi:MAG: DUF1203 domain-containing protein [Micropepsaceae bacterium]
MSFRITGLDPTPFRELFGLAEGELAARGVKRYVADENPGFPDRVELRDVDPGENVLLLNYVHLPVDSPYRSSHAIYVREGAERSYDQVGEIPECLRARLISLRAFDNAGMMVDADVVEGRKLEELIGKLLAIPEVSFLHAHFARRGCYAARIDRVDPEGDPARTSSPSTL